ncbi:putative transcription factor Trihelix family [Helianthus annuus]|uniref:trihelix transcription factor ASIL2-like n=1 Tax=Helianthus annuus TaxID=4232 RepID=UPI000B8FA287|nr:trihelix transcription factor ASIL2-like [Helianthus annuus]XP_021981014.1 trihelix transcription factor ASIL2-like [Helianthus annuus]XP_021981015.1 trihelix transcription factor ASIL2-like [Helianthus annuus]KAJ0524485.1 putative transcription factor Trihelix family [Helianthus annuus]
MDYNQSVRNRRPARNNNNYHNSNTYNEYENDEYEEENEGMNMNPRYGYQEPDDEEDEEDDDNNNEYQHGYYRVSGTGIDVGESSRRHQKKRRLDNIVSSYEYANAPRVSERSSGDEWSENATYVLLEVWGDRFLQLGRKSLRGDDWVEVAEKVSEMCKMEIDEAQCRNRLEALKKKYKKEKAKMEDMGMLGREGYNGKWGFFKKMDMLLAPKKQHSGLPCGVDSGEYVFMNTKAYLNNSNALDEMRDSPCESESDDDDDHDDGKDEEGFRLLAESVQNFGEIYEKIEGRKRQQMLELEKMRMDFQRELELQKKQILERAQAEIAKIREGDDEDGNSVENLSG